MAADEPEPGDDGVVESLRIERRGGFAGLRAAAEACTATMSAEQQAAVCQLLLVDGATASAAPPPRPDRFRYRVCLAFVGGTERRFELAEEAMPEALAALVRPTLADPMLGGSTATGPTPPKPTSVG